LPGTPLESTATCMRLLVLSCALLALAACQKPHRQSADQDGRATEVGPTVGDVKGVDRSHKGKVAPDVSFKDPGGEETSLAEFSGKPVLVNLWATWCAPCVKELPTLDRLKKSLGNNNGIQVVAVSQDNAPHASVVAFLEAHRIQDLDAYQDGNMDLSAKAGAEVLPTSILYDAQGREVWRYVGDLNWTSPEATKLLAEAGAPQRH
jgi:thiol-disulfide isomerase/thioredoxin